MNIKENIYANKNLTKSQEDVIDVINSQGLETFFHTSTYGSEVTPNTEGGYGGYAHQMAIRGNLYCYDHMKIWIQHKSCSSLARAIPSQSTIECLQPLS